MDKLQSISLGERIKRFREFKGLKQATMAHMLKLSVNGYGKIERDESSIKVDRLEQIAAILDVSVSQLMSYDDNAAGLTQKDSDYILLEMRVRNIEELLIRKGLLTL